jgi:Fe-S cluster assembly protein SufD
LPEGISFTPLAEALTQEDENVIAIMEQAIQDCVNGFAALNIAYLSDGACLRVAKNTVVPEPVNLVFVNRGVENSVAHTRNLLFLEQGSEVSITETYVGLGDNNYFTNTQSEIVLGENANLNHYKLQQEGGKGNHIAGLNAVQQAHSYLGCHNLSLGSLLMRQDITNVMAAEGSECLINGLMLGRDRQHMDLHTRIEHTKPHCTSREYFRGILDDRARGVVDGRVIVHPQAQKTDAHLASNNLLLSRHSEMDVKPQLEIYADDVKCTHGTTVGQMDDDALFYLRSRGLDEEAARALVTYAFANDILSRVPSEAIRSSSQNLLISRMPQARYIKELL